MEPRTTSPEEFVKAVKELGGYAHPLHHQKADEPPGVNVWFEECIAPQTTVWWPRPGHPRDGIVWGHHFEHGVHRDITGAGLAEKVKETLP